VSATIGRAEHRNVWMNAWPFGMIYCPTVSDSVPIALSPCPPYRMGAVFSPACCCTSVAAPARTSQSMEGAGVWLCERVCVRVCACV